MLIGHFTEQPWQDDNSGLMGTQSTDLSISNEYYNPSVGASLYNRYLDEKVYAEEMGFDALMLNEHHSTPFCMQGVTNVGASILGPHHQQGQDNHPGQLSSPSGRTRCGWPNSWP